MASKPRMKMRQKSAYVRRPVAGLTRVWNVRTNDGNVALSHTLTRFSSQYDCKTINSVLVRQNGFSRFVKMVRIGVSVLFIFTVKSRHNDKCRY